MIFVNSSNISSKRRAVNTILKAFPLSFNAQQHKHSFKNENSLDCLIRSAENKGLIAPVDGAHTKIKNTGFKNKQPYKLHSIAELIGEKTYNKEVVKDVILVTKYKLLYDNSKDKRRTTVRQSAQQE